MKLMNEIIAFFRKAFSSSPSHKQQFREHQELQNMVVYFTDRSRFCKLINRAYSMLDSELILLKRHALNLGLQSKAVVEEVPVQPLETWGATVERAGSSAINAMVQEISDLRENLNITNEKLEKPIEENVSESHQTRRSELDTPMLKFLKEEKDDTTELQEEIVTLERDIADCETAKIDALGNLGNKVPIKNFMDSRWVLLAELGIFIVVELNVIMHSFKAMRLTASIGYSISIALSLLIAFSSSWMGNGIVNKHRFNFLMGLMVGIGSIGAVAAARFYGAVAAAKELPLDTEARSIHEFDYFFLFLNLLLWVFAFVFETNRQKRQAYFAPREKADKAIKVKAKLQKQLNRISVVDRKKAQAIENEYQARLLKEAYSERELLTFKKAELESHIQTISEELKMFKNNLHLIQEYGTKLFHENFRKGLQSRRPNINGFQLNGFIILCLTIGLGSGCTAVEEKLTGQPEHIEVWLANDNSLKSSVQNEVNFNELSRLLTKKVMHLDEKKPPRTKVDVFYTEINELMTPPIVEVALLAEGEPYLSRVELDRLDSILVFKAKLKKFIEEKFGEVEGLPTSQVNQCLCRSLNRLSESHATRKVMVIYSDLMEHTLSMSFHGKNAPDIVGKDYDRVAQIFSESCSLKDLNGIEILVVFSPRKENQEEVLNAQNFWKKYLESQGATLEFKPNF